MAVSNQSAATVSYTFEQLDEMGVRTLRPMVKGGSRLRKLELIQAILAAQAVEAPSEAPMAEIAPSEAPAIEAPSEAPIAPSEAPMAEIAPSEAPTPKLLLVLAVAYATAHYAIILAYLALKALWRIVAPWLALGIVLGIQLLASAAYSLRIALRKANRDRIRKGSKLALKRVIAAIDWLLGSLLTPGEKIPC
jgi:nucleoid-associated protein YgaU